jgi:hypothetical protein
MDSLHILFCFFKQLQSSEWLKTWTLNNLTYPWMYLNVASECYLGASRNSFLGGIYCLQCGLRYVDVPKTPVHVMIRISYKLILAFHSESHHLIFSFHPCLTALLISYLTVADKFLLNGQHFWNKIWWVLWSSAEYKIYRVALHHWVI